MRYILLFTLFCSYRLYGQNSIYDQQLKTGDNRQINLQDYKGKKIVIASVAASNLQAKEAFNYWDSLQSANPKLAVILIPSNDFTTADSISPGTGISVPATSKTIVSASVAAKKDKGTGQDPLMKWLTHADMNTHFDADVSTDKQLFVISESGILYAVLGNGTPVATLNSILTQSDIKK